MPTTTTISSSSSSSSTTTIKSTTATTTTTTTTTTTSSTKPLPVFEKLLPKTAAPRGSTATENVPEASQPIADKLVLADSPEKLMSVPAETSKEDQQSFTSYIEKICPVLTVFALPIILIIEIINAYSYICLLKNNNKPKIITACCNNCDSAEKKGPTEV